MSDSEDLNEDEVLMIKQPLTPAPRRVTQSPFKRLTKTGSSLKLQNGSYPTRYSTRHGNNNNNNNSVTKNKNEKKKNLKNKKSQPIKKKKIISEIDCTESEVSFASEFPDDAISNVSSELYDESMRSSSPMSDVPSLRSEQASMVSVDSTYGTSEFSSFSSASKASRDYMYDFERLANVLDHIDGEVLKEQLKSCLMSKKPRNIKTLSSLLPASKFSGKTTHCFRCHSEYDEKHGCRTCIIRHPNSEVLLISEDGTNAVFQCERCACVFKLDNSLEYDEQTTDISNCGACYVGEHTSNSKSVDYLPNGVAKTCTEKGCAIFYV
eukprot:TCONS_00057471-protein